MVEEQAVRSGVKFLSETGKNPLTESNLEWESPKGPILVKPGLSLQQLKLDKADIASGRYASVSIFEMENGDKLAGKISKNKMKDGKGRIKDDLAAELKAYQTIYDAVYEEEKVGPHPNLVNVYGIAQVPNEDGAMKRTMLMDAVPGPSGKKAFAALRESWKAHKISSAEYWGALQFIVRRLLDVTEHISKAGVVHCDIKPTNVIVNENTGEPVLIDLGEWSKKGEKNSGGTPMYRAPELWKRQPVDERTDVFGIGALLVSAMEGAEFTERWPNQGFFKLDAVKDRDGNLLRKKGSYSAETEAIKFINAVMHKNINAVMHKKMGIRVTPQEAKKLPFLTHSLLDDDAAKKVITKVLALDRMEAQKPIEEQWKRTEPRLPVSQERTAHTTSLIKAFKKNLEAFKQERRAEKFIKKASWFDDVKRISEKVSKTAIKSGVDENGIRIKNPDQNGDSDYEQAVREARQDLVSYAKADDLRLYVHKAEAFLSKAGTLKSEISKPKIEKKIQQVRERMVVARGMVEIFGTDLSSSGQPENGNVNVQGRVAELERQRDERLRYKRQLTRRR